MAIVKVTYDGEADAAYIYFTDPQGSRSVARMYACDPVEVGGMINLDFDGAGRVMGVEVMDASAKLPQYLLDLADRLDTQDG